MPGGLRLDVHVARSRLDRFEQNFVHQPNDRGLLRHFRQLGAVGFDLAQQLERSRRLAPSGSYRFAADAQVLS